MYLLKKCRNLFYKIINFLTLSNFKSQENYLEYNFISCQENYNIIVVKINLKSPEYFFRN